MYQITMFNNETGEIVGSRIGSAGEDLSWMESLYSYIPGIVDGRLYYIDTATNTAVLKGEPPTEFHTFDHITKLWVDLRPFSEIKEQQWLAIKSARTNAVFSPLDTPYGVFDADVNSQQQITNAVLLMQNTGPSGSIEFTLANNNAVTLTSAEMIEVGLLLGQQTQSAYSKARLLRAQIDAATTIDEVKAIVW